MSWWNDIKWLFYKQKGGLLDKEYRIVERTWPDKEISFVIQSRYINGVGGAEEIWWDDDLFILMQPFKTLEDAHNGLSAFLHPKLPVDEVVWEQTDEA